MSSWHGCSKRLHWKLEANSPITSSWHKCTRLESLSQGVAEAESRRAADIAEAAYQQAFNKNIPADEAALDREYTKALSAGQAAFREVAVGEANNLVGHCQLCHYLALLLLGGIEANDAGQEYETFCVVTG